MDLVQAAFQRLGVSIPDTRTLSLLATLVCLILTIPLAVMFHFSARPRIQHLKVYHERVLILGASTEKGVGEALALQYARRGCRDLILVGRNLQGLEAVKRRCIEQAKEGEEWDMSDEAPGDEAKAKHESRIHCIAADCSKPEDVDRLRKQVSAKFKGLDTLHICFGVSALLPLLGVAGVDPVRPTDGQSATKVHPDQSGLEAVSLAVTSASNINVSATAICLAAFLPMLQTTSLHPAIVLISSAAALFATPTRSIYAATKSAQLSLFRSLAIESLAHSESTASRRAKVRFLAMCPGTIATSFRHSAVDFDPAKSDMPQDLAWVKGEKMLTPNDVAEKTIFAVDRYATGTITLPRFYAFATWIDKVFPSFIARQARKKYAY
ncbi:NADP-dependent L-serine/L-allo-threonine dehydrogenase [Pseudozyma hubeiensis SY62]|uniref:NADP-dependent L-serine/L-allo-threonine dehydrogenase n=1 Tax=Pseudozyma hubeiensis (strain SY62) TaxID=1305764 RepID=R9P2L0_PSEHS|nr:NADP-dependent L-serine/L-allo-threonine dehydrogenase [Pseudozyma hubeiensis SY62]GAC95643.1 NADP-dependent L-serine/L-allo-threonine dehydrogenase [Pseudozyma hubeiensis SY62]